MDFNHPTLEPPKENRRKSSSQNYQIQMQELSSDSQVVDEPVFESPQKVDKKSSRPPVHNENSSMIY